MTARLMPRPADCGRRKECWIWVQMSLQVKKTGCYRDDVFIPCPSPDEFPEGCPLRKAIVKREMFSEFCGELSTMNFSKQNPGDVVRWAEAKMKELGIEVEEKEGLW